ncbi:PnuC-like ribosyl nicotinamide transporter [Caulobacter phage C1]|nr:PnuC-like ribosyl nicotinamide transporter [Caulobacter phage C1]UTU08565.1 PnuC-like ribosyl nicotinamide transporter [Caulobacter phage C2]UTU09081.1 PnuC-like ribosyl nicotinamide transporter [Caulobacter phage J4]UTU09640.1 PnuC-like ribosyl nicotinamide transporter [Caulobacter phage BL47]UTU10198.1 PnuC-like ribosyl nicotinamide transporter [Caulobacter phage RB23]WGN97232.1 ribosyl nicotinamide transporter, PnuC-like [Bertelyvirus sp.]
MSLLEILATAVTVACVLLAVKRSTWQYPVGIVGTILFFFVFQGAKLYASAMLQVFFTLVQVYGWWYWTRGDRGKSPPITSWSPAFTGAIVVAGLVVGVVLSMILNAFTDAKVALWDSAIFGLSMAAQFLLDRKKLENWTVWGLVNIISVFVYWQQGLTVAAILYAGLFVNAFWGHYEWAKAKRAQKIVWDAEAQKYPAAPIHEPKPGDLLT